MKTTHPLDEKKLVTSPTNWSQWLKHWNETNDPLALQSLLHHGPDMSGADSLAGREKAILIYLQLATRWYQGFGENAGFMMMNENILTCPKKTLAGVAFRTLCRRAFETGKNSTTDETLSHFVYSETLLNALISFLGSDSIETLGHGGDEFAAHFAYANTHTAKTLTDFCLALAKFLITEPYRLQSSGSLAHNQDLKKLVPFWQKHQRSAIKILLHFEKHTTILELAGKLHESAIDALRDYILNQEIVADWKDGNGERRAKLRTVDDIDLLNPDDAWWHKKADLAMICYLYRGIVKQRSRA